MSIHEGTIKSGMDVFVVGSTTRNRNTFTVMLVDGADSFTDPVRAGQKYAPDVKDSRVLAVATFTQIRSRGDARSTQVFGEARVLEEARVYAKTVLEAGVMPPDSWAGRQTDLGARATGKLLLPPAQTEEGKTHLLLQKLGKKARVVVDSKDIDTGEMRVGQMYTLTRQKDGHIAVKSLSQEQEIQR